MVRTRFKPEASGLQALCSTNDTQVSVYIVKVLQQERHALERKLATVEGEHESHLEELCSEIDRLQDGLARHQISNKKTEQEKEEYIGELLQHNQRIGMELKQTTEEKEELVAHIGSLENQVRAGMSPDHVEPALVEEFEKKVRDLEGRKSELMQALRELTSERENMHYDLEDANRRILLLERNVRELESQVFIQEIQLEELRRTHCTTLHDLEELRLSEAMAHIYTSTAAQGLSLFEELGGEMSSFTEADTHMMEESGNGNQLQEKCQKLQGAMNTIQQHILLLTHKLKTWKSGDFDPNVPSTSGINDRSLVPYADDENITPNEIIERIEELQGLLEEIMSERQIQLPPPSPLPDQEAQMEQLHNHITSLRQELTHTQTTVDDLQNEISRQTQLLRERDERIQVLNVKLDYRRSMPDPEALFKRYMNSQDTSSLAILKELTSQPSSSNATPDDASILSDDSLDSAMCLQHEQEIEKLKKERDEAIGKRDSAEKELSEARATLDQLDGQMVGAVHQKLEYCKQTDNWEVDLHEMFDERFKKQLRKHDVGGRKKSKKHLNKAPRKRIGNLK
ncbi:putative bicaudal D-related protein 1-like [Apostichopus japonicus]|uniref:Putative bicaudal D-related protein 1-like n=1 Tax=Stichopus japonicus TaxID=307972 RepID=A0A2G8KN73_STIJA|nr:putative bicaudal D-related protein 1-like [Apostichopus japonicus]